MATKTGYYRHSSVAASPRRNASRALGAALFALATLPPAVEASFELTILHTNDLHSRLRPVNETGGDCAADEDAAGKCFGGIARVKSLIDDRRNAIEAEGGAVIVLDAGDQFQGSLFYTTYRGEAAAEFMNTIGYDAMAVGNHEFDNGPDVLARFADAIRFPLLGANIDAARSASLAGNIDPYTIVSAQGRRVGIVAAITEDTASTSSPGAQVFFEEAESALTRAVATLESLGVDKIVALTHVGLSRDRSIAARVTGIDAIIGGHSHTLLADGLPGAAGTYPAFETGADGRAVPIAHAWALSRVVGELQLVFDDAGSVIETRGTAHLLDARIAPDPLVAARVETLAQPFAELMQRVIGSVPAPVDATRCRVTQCEMGTLVADAMLERTRGQGVEIAIQNGGGLRASFDAGDVTMGELLTVLPFQNTLSTFELSGADLLAALENGVSRVDDGAGRFPQVAGMRFSFDPGKPPGSRIVSVEVGDGDTFEALDPTANYLVASNDYLRRGGDGYEVLRDRATNVYDFGPPLEEVVAAYLASRPGFVPLSDNRIIRTD